MPPEDEVEQIAVPEAATLVVENDLVARVAASDAKIAELTSAIAERDDAIAARDTEITEWKARNYDLLLQIPNTEAIEEAVESADLAVDLDNDEDLFGE